MLLLNSDFGWAAFNITLKNVKIINENFINNRLLVCPLNNPKNNIVIKLTVSWGFYKTNKHSCIEFHMFTWHSFQRTTIKNKTAVGKQNTPQKTCWGMRNLSLTWPFWHPVEHFSRRYSAWFEYSAEILLYKPNTTPHQTYYVPLLWLFNYVCSATKHSTTIYTQSQTVGQNTKYLL